MNLTSTNNEKVKTWEKLKQKKYRDLYKMFLIEDEHLINEALKQHTLNEIITIDENLKFDIPTYYVNDKIMKKISEQKSGAKIIGVSKILKERDVKGNIIVLDNIQDPGNLGTIIRSAVAFNFDSIILSENCVDLYNAKVIRASEGMLFHINIKRCRIIEFLNNLDKDYIIIGTDVHNGEDIKKISFKKCAIVIGNEGNGLSNDVKKCCHKFAYIKMNNQCESLNAGVSASILMYEVNHE